MEMFAPKYRPMVETLNKLPCSGAGILTDSEKDFEWPQTYDLTGLNLTLPLKLKEVRTRAK